MHQDPETDGVWAENVEAAMAFLSVQTQWRWQSMGMQAATIAGLDYSAARAGIEAAGFDVTPALWADVILIEAGALMAKSEDR